jgi:thioredoxin reductase (NADPH)
MISVDELKALELFKSFDDADLLRFSRKAADLRVQPGEWLLREGEPPYFGVLLEGRVMLVKDILGTPRDLPEYSLEVGEFYGELALLMGVGSVISLRAETACRVARFERQHFARLVQASDAARSLIMQKMNERLLRVQRIATELPALRVVILGTEYDTDCRDVRSFLSANRIPYDWVDREKEPHRVPACVPDNLRGPGVVIDGELFIHPPSAREVARALKLQTEPQAEHYDVVIVGAGPAGMAAGVYGASEGLSVLMVERSAAGGQAGTSSRIENYLGFPESISGEELTGRALKQAIRFGAEIAMTRSIQAVTSVDGRHLLELDGGQRVSARAVLLATGVEWRRLNVEGADRLLGRGVLYGASRTEGPSVSGRRVCIVGGGNSAGQAALFFSNHASEVKVLVRGEGLHHSMSQYLIDQLATKRNIQVLPFTEVVSVQGEDHVERVVLRTRAGQETTQETLEAGALFVMIGADAITAWLPRELERDAKGYVCTGRDLKTWCLEREAFPLETSLPGVFCAGDVRHGSIKRVSSGVGEGSMAIAFIHQYLALQEGAHAPRAL